MTRPAPSLARWTGLAYLGIIASGLFAEIGVRLSTVVDGDPGATAAGIAASSDLFRAGILADVAMVGFDVAVAVGLLVLLQHVSKPLAQLAAALRLIQAAVISANLMNMANALFLATGGPSADAIGPAAQGLVLSSMELHGLVYDLGLVFFGLACLVLGRLLIGLGSVVTTALGVSVGLAGCVYLIGTFAALFAPAWSAAIDPLYGVAFLAELAFAGWLLAGAPAWGARRATAPAAAA